MKKATSIQDIIEACISDATSKEKLIPMVIAGAAKRRNLIVTKYEVEQFAHAVLDSTDGEISVNFAAPCGFGSTDDEIKATLKGLFEDFPKAIEETLLEITNAVSLAIPDALSDFAEIIFEGMTENAGQHLSELRKAQAERVESVRRLWGNALDQLDSLRNIVLEWNCEAIERRTGGYANPNTAFALQRLVARAYDVVGEITTLARGGYADGALARWRSLHEICVISMFLVKQSDECAQMYLFHHQIEELRIFEVGVDNVTNFSTNTDYSRYVSRLRVQKAALVRRFGAAFANDNGWASIELGRARTTFKELEAYVGLEVLRRGYQRANSTVHAGALATLTRVSLDTMASDDSGLPPEYGCEMAISFSASSLSMMVAELCLESDSADLIAMSVVVHKHASQVHDTIEQTKKIISGNSPRAKILARRVFSGKLRSKRQRNPSIHRASNPRR